MASGTLSQQNFLWFYDGTNQGTYAYGAATGCSTLNSGSNCVQLAGVWNGLSGTYNAMSTGGRRDHKFQQFPWVEMARLGSIPKGHRSQIDNYATNEMLRKAWARVGEQSRPVLTLVPAMGPSQPRLTGDHYGIPPAIIQCRRVSSSQPFVVRALWCVPDIAYGHIGEQFQFNDCALRRTPYLTNRWELACYGPRYDANNFHGTFYDTIQTACGSQAEIAAGSFYSIHGQQGCGWTGSAPPYPGGPPTFVTSRANSVEGGTAMLQYYLENPTPARRALVDQFYGAVFGQPGTCAPSVASTCDGYTASNFTNTDLSAHYKWPGFFFGMGGCSPRPGSAWRNIIHPPRTPDPASISRSISGAQQALGLQ